MNLEANSPLLNLLGTDNVKKLQEGIVEVILDAIRNDFRDSGTYILSPDDIYQDLYYDIIDEVKERVKEAYADKITKKLIKALDISLDT